MDRVVRCAGTVSARQGARRGINCNGRLESGSGRRVTASLNGPLVTKRGEAAVKQKGEKMDKYALVSTVDTIGDGFPCHCVIVFESHEEAVRYAVIRKRKRSSDGLARPVGCYRVFPR